MPLSALPEHLNSPEEIEANFADDSQFGTSTWYGRLYKWLKKSTKAWRAFSYRCHEPWAKWRKVPYTICRFGSHELWRIEYFEDKDDVLSYVSRIQYHMKHYLIIQWPFSIYFKVSFGDKFLYGYGPIHYDADSIFWLFSFFLGTTYK